MRLIKYLVINGVFALSVYYGLVENYKPAYNLMIFYIWATVVLCLLGSFSVKKVIGELKQKNHKPTIPRWVDLTFDILVTSALVWYGHFVLATAYILHSLFLHGVWIKALEDK